MSETSPKILSLIPEYRPVLVLAPMQDVTDLPFWRVMSRYGGPDIYFTEYFRVHPNSTPEKHILRCIRENPTGRPALAQMIGQDLSSLVRTGLFLENEDVLGIDLNLGCPAPIVCKKNSGGGMLRDLEKIHKVLDLLSKEITQKPFTVKTRIGFYAEEEFDQLLKIFASYPIAALTVHGRTVQEMYRSQVHYDRIAQAVKSLQCPVIANGNILSAAIAKRVAEETGASGLMIGRGCIRNPWIWRQIDELYDKGEVLTRPTLQDLYEYIHLLYDETRPEGLPEKLQVAKMKKYMTFIAQGLSENDEFLKQIRRAQTQADFFRICKAWLDYDDVFDPEVKGGALINPGNPRTDCHKRPVSVIA
ncbi:MAG: tRNA-dihydrouridine synthase family protein [Verrucomicrobiota bacterium]